MALYRNARVFNVWGHDDYIYGTLGCCYQNAGEGHLGFVIDSIDVDRMNLAKKELHKMVAHEDLVGCKILIFANKQDAKGALPVAEISKRLNLSVLQGKSYHIQDCCALTGEGLYDGMEWMSNQIRTR